MPVLNSPLTKGLCDKGAHPARRVWTRTGITDSIRALNGASVPLYSDAVQFDRSKLTSDILHATLSRPTTGAKLWSASGHIFGSWPRALEAAGLDPQQVTACPRFWTRELIIKSLQRLNERGIRPSYGRVATNKTAEVTEILSQITGYHTTGSALTNAVRKRFGSWNAALTAAGLSPSKIRRNCFWSKEVILETIGLLHRADIPLSCVELDRNSAQTLAIVRSATGSERSTGSMLYLAGRKQFGSWNAALKAAGLDPSTIRLAWSWTPELMVRCIKAMNASGIPVNARALSKNRFPEAAEIIRRETGRSVKTKGLYQRACTYFGSWEKALAAAELDASTIKRNSFWNREKITQSIIALNEQQISINCTSLARKNDPEVRRIILDHVGLQTTGPGLHRAACQQFGSWDRALEAAALNPKEIRLYRRWTTWRKFSITRVLRLLDKLELPLNVRSVCESDDVRGALLTKASVDINGSSLYRIARARFGSWDAALRSAKLDPCQIRKQGAVLEQDREVITKMLLLLHENGLPLNHSSIINKSPIIKILTCKKLNQVVGGYSILGAATRKFGSWDAALEAANFNPHEIRLRSRRTSNLTIIPHQVERIKMPDGSSRKVTYYGVPPPSPDKLLDEQLLSNRFDGAVSDLSKEDRAILANALDLIAETRNGVSQTSIVALIEERSNGTFSAKRITQVFEALKRHPLLLDYKEFLLDDA